MRTSERNYLQSIGFADDDRKTPYHDDVCLYLMQREKIEKIVKCIANGYDIASSEAFMSRLAISNSGYPIAAADILIEWKVSFEGNILDKRPIVCEIKTTKQPIGSIIQQLGFYRAVFGASTVLFTTLRMTESEGRSLESSGHKFFFVSQSDVDDFRRRDKVEDHGSF